MSRFVAVDLETTGVDSKQDYIVEVGIAGEDRYGVYFEEEFSLDFPADAMSQGAAAVNGWGKRQFAPILTHQAALAYLEDVLNDAYIIGKVVAFDVAFLEQFFREMARKDYPMKFPWHHRTVDIGPLAWGWHNGLGVGRPGSVRLVYEPPNTEAVERMVGIPRITVDGFHTALNDARWDYEVFRNIIPKGD